MRLPQSRNTSLSVRIASTIILLIVAVLPRARAATQLQFSPASLKLGAVAVGQSETQSVIVTNTGQTSVTISALGVGDAEFSVSGLTLPAVLAPAQTVGLSVTFSPTETGWVGTNVTLTNNSSSPNLRLAVAGSGVSSEALNASPASLSFGQVAVGANTTLSVVLTNTGSGKITLNALQIAGSGFSVSGPSFPLVLGPGKNISVIVVFAPQVVGVSAGSIFISGPRLNIPLTGTGITIGQLGISPTALNFGSVDVGTTGTQQATLTASGGSVTITSAASSNSQYSIAGASFPMTIGAGQNVPISVVFAPANSGTVSGTLTFTSNASTSPSSESLTGIGVVPQYSVSLSWSPSTSSVVGYNIYRGITVGTYSKINTSLDSNTNYSDNSVASGVTYYYAATAVNSAGQESGYSTPIEVSIP